MTLPRIADIEAEMQARADALDALETEQRGIQQACTHYWIPSYEPQRGPSVWVHCEHCGQKGDKTRDFLQEQPHP